MTDSKVKFESAIRYCSSSEAQITTQSQEEN